MNPGEVVLLEMPEVRRGAKKLRPAPILSTLPGPYQTLLVCGFSTQLAYVRPNWDEVIQLGDPDFGSSGLSQVSVLRLSFLRAAVPTEIVNCLDTIEATRLARLQQRLSDHLRP
jgi:hypothetical protein